MHTDHPVSRRHFLHAAAGLALAGGFAAACKTTDSAGGSRRLTVACRDSHLKATGQPDCWAAMQFLGINAAEVSLNDTLACPGLYHPEKKYGIATDDDVKALAGDLAAHGAIITAFCTYTKFEERPEQEVALMRKVVPVAQKLGVKAIRIDVVAHKMTTEEFLPHAVKVCKQMCDAAEGTSVRFAIENHSKTSNDPAFLDKLFDGVGSTRLGLTLDALNFYWYGWALDEIYGYYEKFAPRVFHTHCKSVRYPADKRNVRRPMGWEYAKYAAPIYEGDIDYKRVVAILRKANYQGDLCLENECLRHFPVEQQPGVLKKEIEMLKSLA